MQELTRNSLFHEAYDAGRDNGADAEAHRIRREMTRTLATAQTINSKADANAVVAIFDLVEP